MHQYYYRITTAKKMSDFTAYTKDIEASVKAFNKASHRARNYKNIVEPIEIETNTIAFILESEHDLGNHPSLRPLWLFSKLLLEYDALTAYCVNKRFLKALVIKRLTNDQASSLSDNEILKTVVDLYLPKTKPSSYMATLNKEVKDELRKLIESYLDKIE